MNVAAPVSNARGSTYADFQVVTESQPSYCLTFAAEGERHVPIAASRPAKRTFEDAGKPMSTYDKAIWPDGDACTVLTCLMVGQYVAHEGGEIAFLP